MDHKPLPGRKTLSCLMLALFACPASLRADYVPPSASSALAGEVSEFARDFKNWNASQHNKPLLFLASTPAPEQGDMVLLLFMLWLEKQPSGGPMGAETTGSGVIGTILDDLGLPGHFATGSADTSGSGSSLANLPLPICGPDNGSNSDVPYLSGPPAGSSDPAPFGDPVAAPEPASLALLATGAAGFLMLGIALGRERARLKILGA